MRESVKKEAEEMEQSNGFVMVRMRRLLEVRRAEFESWPVTERDRLRQAFAMGDPSGLAALDAKGLAVALEEIGLQGRSREEREILQNLTREATVTGSVNFFDFVFQVVPQVQQGLFELRSPKLCAQFAAYDSSNTGRLVQQQCLDALKRHATSGTTPLDEEGHELFWKAWCRDFPDLYEEAACSGESGIDIRGFQIMAEKLDAMRAEILYQSEKRTVLVTSLPQQLETAFLGELSRFHRAFSLYDPQEQGVLSASQVTLALFDCGALPIAGDVLERALAIFDRYEDSERFCFADFLGFIERFRNEEAAYRQAGINKALMSSHWLTGPPMLADDVPALVLQLGLCTDCGLRFDDIVPMVDECSKEGAEALDTAELVVLTGKVTEWARVLARRRERAIATEAGLSVDELFELRISFAGLTHTGVVGVQEVMSVLQHVNPRVHVLEKDVELIFAQVSPAAARALELKSHPDGVRFADAGSHHSHGDSAAVPHNYDELVPNLTLGFDGYLRIMALLLKA